MLTINKFTPTTSNITVADRRGRFHVELTTDKHGVSFAVIWPAREGETCETRITAPRISGSHPEVLESLIEAIDGWFAEFPGKSMHPATVRALLALRKEAQNFWMEHQ